MSKTSIALLLVLAAVLIGASQSLFIVDQREQAVVLQLGQPIGNPEDPGSYAQGPGLHFKIPIVQEVRYFDRRILSVDPPPEQVVIASSSLQHYSLTPAQKAEGIEPDPGPTPAETAPDATPEPQTPVEAPEIQNVSGEPIIADTFARYKIVAPLQFLKTLRTTANADQRLESILNDATRGVLGSVTLQALLSSEREAIMEEIKRRVNQKITQDSLGIEIVDVRIVRADLTADLRTSTVRRMISDLKERATETRAKGEQRALEIRSTAEKDRTVLLAEASRDAQMIKGQGDKDAIKIYADAFNKDKDFYGFIRSMEAYKNTLADPETRLILSPGSDFFRYFKDHTSGPASP
ncbi:MAG: protease modulator HflC [Alphaproteobacteria bacterium]|jgi:membrane protease subunit HflC|nr:protease modulator HflC [Alphaproteobacteria bacterium]